MEMKPDASRVLMSEVLRGQVPELEGEEAYDPLKGKHVIVVAEKLTAGTQASGLVGILRNVLFGAEPVIEFRVPLSEALDLVEAPSLSFGKFELHHEERIISMPGPFIIKGLELQEISAQDQLCNIVLSLKKPAR